MKRSLIFITALCAFPLSAMELTDDEHNLIEQIAPRTTLICGAITECLNGAVNSIAIAKHPINEFTDLELVELKQLYRTTNQRTATIKQVRQFAQESCIARFYITHDLEPIRISLRLFGISAITSASYFLISDPSITKWKPYIFAVGVGGMIGSILGCIANMFFVPHRGYRKNERLLDEGLENAQKIKEILEKDPRIIHWLASQQPPANPMPQPEDPD